MITTTDLLTLTHWLSPAFPVGAFSYSHGLEQAIDTGQVRDAAALALWVEDVLSHGGGQADARFLAAAWQADSPQDVGQIDAMARAFAASSERLLETVQQGRAFCDTTRAIWGLELSDLSYPVAVGAAARARGLPCIETSAVFLHAFAANLVSVGIRLIPLGQTEGHRVIQNLTAACEAIAQATSDGDLSALTATAFLADIAAMRHETQSTRIFRT